MRASRTDLWGPRGEIPLGYPADGLIGMVTNVEIFTNDWAFQKRTFDALVEAAKRGGDTLTRALDGFIGIVIDKDMYGDVRETAADALGELVRVGGDTGAKALEALEGVFKRKFAALFYA